MMQKLNYIPIALFTSTLNILVILHKAALSMVVFCIFILNNFTFFLLP